MQFVPLAFVLALGTTEKSLVPPSLQVLMSPEPPLLQGEQSLLSAFLHRRVFSVFIIFMALCWTLSISSMYLILRGPELDTV